MTTILHENIKIQHMNLPSRYLLIIDGKRANPRQMIAKLLFIFVRVKRKNLLALAMGIWKICLEQSKSLARRPKYAKVAAIHLIENWARAMKAKTMQKWIRRWALVVSFVIFGERNHIVVSMQALYRRWRDSRKFINLHKAGHFNGPLSDIYLAPYRENIRFKIPRFVREERQVYWIAARLIQSHYRRLSCWKEYIRIKLKVILIQSIVRMVPKFYYYLRLKAATIKCQSLMRRTLFRILFKRLRVVTIIVQKYVRRYLCILLKHRMFDQFFRKVEIRMESALMIQ
jgi:hypothetical protein